MTDAEQALWRQLRSRRFTGTKFRRQHPLGKYIVDFVALDQRLIIELDGGQHNVERLAYDDKRTQWLNREGYTVIRYWNHEVLSNMAGVLEEIEQWFSPSPPPLSPQGRGEK